MVVGGYQTVPRGLMLCPTPLNVRRQSPVKKITYSRGDSSQKARIECDDGYSIEADYVVSSIPLGVLKHGSVEFSPPLPAWKSDAINRLGFGVLNKVILVYEHAFWDASRDIFGILRNPQVRSSLVQKDYAAKRGRMFQWFNVSNTTGLPCLIALMAGDAASEAETTCNDELIAEATEVLRSVFGPSVPNPVESVVTRWASDKFARGSYSSAGPDMKADDYDTMARPIGNLYFAGEHTIGSHPATVHGAYLSGLRAAGEVIDAMLGPIEIPIPLILPKESSFSLKRKASEDQKGPLQLRLEAYEKEVWSHVRSKIGDRPYQPAKAAANAYLHFNKANYNTARKICEENRRPGKSKPIANEVRIMTAKMWKEATPEVRMPFQAMVEQQKKVYAQAINVFREQAAEWDRKATEIKLLYEKEHPSVPGPEELAGGAADPASAKGRRPRKVESYAEGDSDVEIVD